MTEGAAVAPMPNKSRIVGVILALLLALGTGVAFAQGGTTDPAPESPAVTSSDDAAPGAADDAAVD